MTRSTLLYLAGGAAILALALAAAACAGSASGSAAPVSANEVTMVKSYRFAPATIQVAAGATVTWRNQDNFSHSVKVLDGSEPDRVVKPGESTTITFNAPGEYRYECSLHPRDMKGKVIVTGGS